MIRKGKIKGKKIYDNLSWQISPQEIIDYCRKTQHPISPDSFLIEKKFLSLKEAAKISGYSPDYIGYLVRKSKIKGKETFTGVSWLTTEKDIKKYQKLITKKEKKIISDDLKKFIYDISIVFHNIAIYYSYIIFCCSHWFTQY